MTDRIRYLTVVLDNDYRDDDAKIIADAIQMFGGVDSVKLGEPTHALDYVNRAAIRSEMLKRIAQIIHEGS